MAHEMAHRAIPWAIRVPIARCIARPHSPKQWPCWSWALRQPNSSRSPPVNEATNRARVGQRGAARFRLILPICRVALHGEPDGARFRLRRAGDAFWRGTGNSRFAAFARGLRIRPPTAPSREISPTCVAWAWSRRPVEAGERDVGFGERAMNSAGIARRRCAIPRVIAPDATLDTSGETGSSRHAGPRVPLHTGITGEKLSDSHRSIHWPLRSRPGHCPVRPGQPSGRDDPRDQGVIVKSCV